MIIVFGSRAKGDRIEESDYGIIIANEKFRVMNFVGWMEKTLRAMGSRRESRHNMLNSRRI